MLIFIHIFSGKNVSPEVELNSFAYEATETAKTAPGVVAGKVSVSK